jgi:hypothetical protein
MSQWQKLPKLLILLTFYVLPGVVVKNAEGPKRDAESHGYMTLSH